MKNNSSNENKQNNLTEHVIMPVLSESQKTYAFYMSLCGWLIPGSGYLFLRQKMRAVSLFLILNGLFLWGMALRGEIAFPVLDTTSNEFNLVNILVFIMGIGNVLMTFVNMIPGLHQGDITASTYEIGTLFMVVSSGLNVFVLFHAWDAYRFGYYENTGEQDHD